MFINKIIRTEWEYCPVPEEPKEVKEYEPPTVTPAGWLAYSSFLSFFVYMLLVMIAGR